MKMTPQKRFLMLVLAIVIAVSLVSLTACGGERLDEANKLFEEGKFAEALAIYEEIGDTDKVLVATNMVEAAKGNYKTSIKAILTSGVSVTIVYDLDGGDFEDGSSKTTLTYKKANEFKDVKEVNKDGSDFDAWKITSSVFDEDGGLKISLKALWNAETYPIIYELNGGELTGEGISEYPGDKDTTLVAPVKTGHTFIGFTGEGIDEPTLEVVIPAGSSGEKTYTAHWMQNSYTVSFDKNGGECETESTSVTYGNFYELPAASKEGVRFGGWYVGDEKYENSGTWNTASDVTLKAVWLPKYTFSILGDSISSYFGVTDDGETYHSSMTDSPSFYKSINDTGSGLQSVNDTYWKMAADALNLDICVPNGCAASRVTDTIPESYDGVVTGLARANALHRDGDNTQNPDIILVYMGTNDVGNKISIDMFTPTYRELLETIKVNYPNAKIFVATLLPMKHNSNIIPKADIEKYNAEIKRIAGLLELSVVDFYAESGITEDNYTNYTVEGLHPNKNGMQMLAECLERAISFEIETK
jgi:uncharacterized repeat protein (TIGR02543 family)